MKSGIPSLLLSLALLTASMSRASAATIIWTNTAGGNWSAAANWSPNAVPGSLDAAVITNAGVYTVTNNATVTVAALVLGLDPGTNPPVAFPRLRHTVGTLTVTNLSVAANAILTMTSPLTVATSLNGGGAIEQPASSLRLLGTGVIGTYSLAGGEQRGGALTVTNFNWTDGNLYSDVAGDRLTVSPGGVFNYVGPSDRYLSYYTGPGRRLENFGTWNWSGAGSLRGQGGAVVVNHATVNVTTNSQFNWGGTGPAPVWINHGTFNRTAGTDFFYFNNVHLTNHGGIYVSTGSLSVYNSTFTNGGVLSVSGPQLQFWAGSGTNNGSISVAPTTLFTVESGSSVGLGPTASLSVPGFNNARLISGAVVLRTTNVSTPSLWISGATLYQQTNIVVAAVNLSGGALQLDVPATLAQLNQTNGYVQGRTLTVTNWSWYDGTHYRGTPGLNAHDDRTIIPAGGVLHLLGAAAHTLSYYSATGPSRTLDNYGTIHWSGNAVLYSYGTVNNHGSVNVSAAGTPQYAVANGNVPPTWNNYGTFTRSAGTVFYFNGAYVNNTGLLDVQQGTLSLYGSTFTNHGTLTVAASAVCQSENGSVLTFSPSSRITAPTLNSIRLGGAAAYLQSTNVISPSIWQQAGTLYQQTNIVVAAVNLSGGALQLDVPATLAQLNQTNGYVQGRTLTVTNWSWYDGTHYRGTPGLNAHDDRTIIPAGGVLHLLGAAAHTLSYYSATGPSRTLDNFGTIHWAGNAVLYSYGTVNNHGSVNVSAAGTPQYAVANGNVPPTWNNYGTFTRSAGTVFYFNGAYVNNTGLLDVQQGTLSLYGSTFTNLPSGVVQAAAGTIIANDNGSVTCLEPDSSLLCSGDNAFQLNSGHTYLRTLGVSMPSLLIAGGTLHQLTNNVLATINQSVGVWRLHVPVNIRNYYQTNGELRGANVIITNFVWLGGSLNAENAASNTMTIPAGGTLTIAGPTAKNLSDYSGGNGRRLIHRGTGTWSGAGISGAHGAQFLNQGSLVLTSDAGLANGGGTGIPVFYNQGTFSKTDGAGVAMFASTLFTNAGTLNIVRGGITIGGVFHQTAGSANLGTNFTASSDVRIDAGTFAGRGSIAGTFYNNGLSSAGAPVGLITGTSWTNSPTGTIRFEIGGTNPGANFDQFRLSGPASVSGTADLALANGFVPAPGNTFTALVTSARSGTFSKLTFSGGYEFSTLYTPTSVVFRAENALPIVGLAPLTGTTQVVCNPFVLRATASDLGGAITNLAILQGGSVMASSSASPLTTRVESDFPGLLEFVARAMDDQGGMSYATQAIELVTYPVHLLTLGGVRSNGFKICMVGHSGSNYMVLASTNVALPQGEWTPVGLMEATNGIWRYFDAGTTTNRTLRYYRAQQAP